MTDIRTTSITAQVEHVDSSTHVRVSGITAQVEHVDATPQVNVSSIVVMVEYTTRTPAWVPGVRIAGSECSAYEWTLTIACDTRETTGVWSAGARTYLVGEKGATATIKSLADTGDAAQAAMIAALHSGAEVFVQLYEDASSYWHGDALVSRIDGPTDVDAMADITFGLTFNDLPSYTTN